MSKKNTVENKLNWGMLSSSRNLLFGVAILWIMIFHTSEVSTIKSWEGFTDYSVFSALYEMVKWGGAGVDIFVFLSGIGLYYSFSRNSDVLNFYAKRLRRVLIPYLFFGIIFWITYDVVYGVNPDGFWEDFLGITFYTEGTAKFWYIIFILIMYLIYPLIHYMLESRARIFSLLLLLALSYGIILLVCTGDLQTYKNIEKALSRVPIFILGCYWGRIVKSAKPMNDLWVVYALVVPWFGGIFQYIGDRGWFPWAISSRIWYGMLAIGICILFSLLFSLTKLSIAGKLINLAGTLSLELYLSHISLRALQKFWYSDYKEWSTSKACVMYFLGVIVSAFVISILYHAASQRISEKWSLVRKK